MPAGFRRHFVGKTLTSVCWCDIIKYALLLNDHMVIFLNHLIQFYLNNTLNLHPLNSTHYAVSYPQNIDRIVTTDCDVISPYVYYVGIICYVP